MHPLQFTLPSDPAEPVRGLCGIANFETACVLAQDGSIDAAATEAMLQTEVWARINQRFMVPAPAAEAPPVRDDIYVAGEVVRVDWNVQCPQAEPILTILEDEFPGRDYTREGHNLVCLYGAYRPPYENTSISWYDLRPAPADLLTEYGIAEGDYQRLIPWYGLKHDLTTKEVMLKIVFETPLDWVSPAFPNGHRFYARIHRQDGAVENLVDAYIVCSAEEMQTYCAEHNLAFPLPSGEDRHIWIWSLVFDAGTGEVQLVKAYQRHLVLAA